MIKYLALLLVITVSGAQAITIQMGKGLQAGVNVIAYGNVLAGGYDIKIGTFDADPAADSSWASVVASFKQFAATTSPTTGTSSGLITATDSTSVVATAPGNATDFNTKPIYFLIGDANAYGVIKGQTLTGTSWTFPADTTGTASVNAIAANATSFVAVIGSEVDNATGVDSFVIGIPEPTTGLLAALAGMVGLMRRKRGQ